MEQEINENLDETLTWLNGYIDAITENEFVKKKQIEKMINRIANDLNIQDPFSTELEDHDDLPF